EPDGVMTPEIRGKCFFVSSARDTWIADLRVAQQPFLGDEDSSLSIHLQPTAFQHQSPTCVVRTHRRGHGQSGRVLDRVGNAAVTREVVVLGPGVETPRDHLDFAVRVPHERRPGIAQPHAIRRNEPQIDALHRNVVRVQHCHGRISNALVVTQDLDAFMHGEHPCNVRICPAYSLEFSRPVGLVVWPCYPGSVVALPFGRHAPARHPRYRFRIGEYASIRLSRRNGQLRRVYSISAGSHFATSTPGSRPASAITLPNGSDTKEWPKNSIPSVPDSS